ncbi:hypothetical protein [Commensalibacter nepenthis]|uniref:MobB n=1 Tax=Commensalibacter nepenthis TaxID=3043872 RepID=A0ABT6QAC3_9PROT|nr:hypothetical protein [Commensalibacter sp. TBRC 10068]MDI2113855.1 hypothetical protein [Commensalibacter sp. TBRC 10068]
MSRLSELIQHAKQSQKQKEEEVEKIIEEKLNKLESNFNARLKQSFGKIDSDLQEQGEKVNQRLLRLYKIPMLCIGGIGVLLVLGVVYLAYLANGYWDEMNEWKQSAEIYKANSQNILLNKCTMDDKTTRICVQVDPQYKDQEWGNNLKVLTIRAD